MNSLDLFSPQINPGRHSRLKPRAMLMLLRCSAVMAVYSGGIHASENAGSTGVIQVDVSKLLNARVVTTCRDGKVVAMRDGIDVSAGLITKAAAIALGSKDEHTLPDDGIFPANGEHPEVILHYSNSDDKSNQVHRSDKQAKEDEYSFEVPPGKYARMFLFFVSAASGPAALHIQLAYADGSSDSRDEVVPDWYKNLDSGDKDRIYLAYNLSKWSKDNKMLEKDHHNIFGIDIHPSPSRALTKLTVHKKGPFVTFWGATGELARSSGARAESRPASASPDAHHE